MLVTSTWKAHMCSKREPFHAPIPLLRYVVPLNGNCRLTKPVVKGPCAREALPHPFNIGVFRYGKNKSATIKQFATNLRTWMKVMTLLLTAITGGIFHKQVLAIGVESMVTRAGLRYTRDYLTPGICSIIKPAAMGKLMSFHAKIHSHVIKRERMGVWEMTGKRARLRYWIARPAEPGVQSSNTSAVRFTFISHTHHPFSLLSHTYYV